MRQAPTAFTCTASIGPRKASDEICDKLRPIAGQGGHKGEHKWWAYGRRSLVATP
jgi:hypothetical protein